MLCGHRVIEAVTQLDPLFYLAMLIQLEFTDVT
jgi:hypothetical protein